MADRSLATRWWENYLVRYLLPSLAGMLIIYWLLGNSNISFLVPPFLPTNFGTFGTAQLVVWLLFGSLYCYFASYPALVFHATRVIDFGDVNGRHPGWFCTLLTPYFLSAGFAVWEGVCAYFKCRITGAIGLLLFAIFQVVRIRIARQQGPFGFRAGYESSISYAYLSKLSQRRSKDAVIEDNGTEIDAKDMVDTYRHLREHGNTALIILLEIALCPLIYLTLGGPQSRARTFAFAAAMAIWVFPSVLIHGAAQHLERRFSRFRYSLRNRGMQSSADAPSPGQDTPPLDRSVSIEGSRSGNGNVGDASNTGAAR